MTLIDRFIIEFDRGLRITLGIVIPARPSPAENVDFDQKWMSHQEKQCSISLMRINHVGEVCAQALYRAQALTTRSPCLSKLFLDSAREEGDHLDWTAQRIQSLGGRRSMLIPFWYGGAFCIGIFAGLFGDQVSLAFMAETESQVEQHLQNHLKQLPSRDQLSRLILEQMYIDESKHRNTALKAGASELPIFIRWGMHVHAEVMRRIVFYV